MALNLSTLTNPATSGDVLAEALTTADFLEGVPVLRNLARGSQKGGDAKQDVALNQPKALPLDANGKGYCYLPVTTGNAPAVTFPTIGSSADFVLEMDVYIVNPLSFYLVSGASHPHRFLIDANRFYFQDGTPLLSSALVAGASTIKIERSSGTITLKQDGALKASGSDSGSYDLTHLSFNGQFSTSGPPLNGYIQKTTLSIGGTEQLNIDFTATNVRHGDTKFKCATGQVVTVNQSGNDPATIIKKPVLRFDGGSDGLLGLLNQTVSEFHYFIAFSILGNGGETSGRIFEMSSDDGSSSSTTKGVIAGIGNGTALAYFLNGAWQVAHHRMFDDANGDMLHQLKITNGSQISKINNADEDTRSLSTTISAEEFAIGMHESGTTNAAIDLEFLALFPASITDAQADDVRNYINNRNNVFSLIDGFGYYFYDAQKAPVGAISSGSSAWNGRIIGSDNGDTDKLATQATSNDAPVGSGYVVTFADNSDHLDIPSISQSGWQICGTSLGTFVYRVDNDAVTELNLLGNAGTVRSIGDLYGIILLPASATGKDIEDARKLLIDRGASDGVSGNTVQQFWQSRNDIVEFKQVDTSSVTSFREGWRFCASLEIFPPLQAPNCTNFLNAWEGNSSLNSFGAIDASSGTTFTSAWKSCSSLQQFPSGAKLGTAASNVNFTSAWQASGLTSFPALDLSKGNNFNSAWRDTSSITSFPSGAKLGTAANNVNFQSAWQSSGLTSFSTPLPEATQLRFAWYDCGNLTDFNLPSLPEATNVYRAWRDTGLTSFSTALPKVNYAQHAWRSATSLTDFSYDVFSNWSVTSITTGVFKDAWDGCTALTAQSVENILTSIDASGQYATSTGASGGTALADAGIDIDYNVATGSLSAATNTAVTSLKSKGWVIVVNGVTL